MRRGWTEFVQSLRSSQDQWFYLFTAFLAVGYLCLRRDTPVDGTDLMLPSVALPSILGGMVAFGLVIGPAYSLAMEKEDGTLLRAKAVPNGLVGYFAGQLVLHSAGLVPQVVAVLVPSFLLFDGPDGPPQRLVDDRVGARARAARHAPIGMMIGALVPGVQKVGMWGMLPVMVLAGISGIFYPVQALWGWVQVVAQVFPMYWLGLGMRSAFLPDSYVAAEIGGSWRTLETVAVLGAWAVVGALVAPALLRRMARRQSGSQVAAAKEAATQWVR